MKGFPPSGIFKASEMADAEDIDVDIFKFGRSKRPPIRGKRKEGLTGGRIAGRIAGRIPPLPPPNYPSSSSDSSSEDDEGRPKRRHRRGTKKNSMAASRLLKRTTKDDTSSNSDSDDVAIVSASKRLKPSTDEAKGLQTPSRSPSPPCHALSLPSPPPPGIGVIGVSSSDKSRQVLNQANDVLNRLLYTTPLESSLTEYQSDIIDLASFTPPAPVQNMNLRIRYKGKVIKYEVNKCDPFSDVLALLAKELEGTSDDKVLLSHKTTTIKPTDSPASLGLTTADIIDAVVMTESALVEHEESANTITIKVQTCSESMKYSLGLTSPLRKVMVAFAKKLNCSLEKLKFTFDGAVVAEDHTPENLDMEDDDCIDVAL